MTAELAVALPAVLLVLAACLGGLRLGVERIRLVDAAAQAARSAARGDDRGASAAAAARSGAQLRALRRSDGLLCAEVAGTVPLLGVPVTMTATSCALAPLMP